MPLDDAARPRSDLPSTTALRSASLASVTILESGRWHPPIASRPTARIIAVRGRPGVGKSTVAANLAIAMAQLRSRVVLLDLDVARPALHRLFGVPAPVAGLQALLGGRVDTIEQALTPTGVRNLFLVSAEGAAPCPAPAPPEQQRRLLEQIWELAADVVVADVGTDPAADDLVDLQALGGLAVVVASPDGRSIRAAFATFRRAAMRAIDGVAGGTTEGAMLVASLAGVTPPPMRDLLATLSARPALRDAIVAALSTSTGRLVGNRARDHEEIDRLHAAARMIRRHLGIAAPLMGIVGASETVRASAGGRPLLLGSGIDRNVELFHTMAEQLLIDETESGRCLPAAPATAATAGAAVSPAGRSGPRWNDDTPLPTPIEPYMRSHPRHPVDWLALFRSDGGRQTAVRVFEVSQVGACIQILPGLDAGDSGELAFPQLAGGPAVRVTVVGVRARLGRAGLRIEGCADVAAELVAAAARVAPAPAPAAPGDGAATTASSREQPV